MSSNENENPLQNSTENHVLKEKEKKVQNSDHNVTERNVDDNEEFFDATCSIPDETNIKEKDAPGKVVSPPKNDNTTLGNNNGNRNEHQDDSKEEGNVIENESNEEHIIEVVDDTDNLVAKNNVVDETIQLQLENPSQVCTTRDIKEEMIKESLSNSVVGGTLASNVSNEPNKHTNDNVDIVTDVDTNNKQTTNPSTATTTNTPDIDDGKESLSNRVVGGTLASNVSNEPNKHTNENVDIVTAVDTNNKQTTNPSTATTTNTPDIDDGKDDN